MSRMNSVTIDTHADREGYTELEKNSCIENRL